MALDAIKGPGSEKDGALSALGGPAGVRPG